MKGLNSAVMFFGKSIMYLVNIKTSWFTQQQQWGLYSNKVTSSLAATQNQATKLTNVKLSIKYIYFLHMFHYRFYRV